MSLLLEADAEYCVVTEEGVPTDLVSDRRVVLAVHRFDRPLAENPLSVLATGFDEPIAPHRTLLSTRDARASTPTHRGRG